MMRVITVGTLLGCALLIGIAACTVGQDPKRAIPEAPVLDAAGTLARTEAVLLAAPWLRVRSHITAAGAIDVDVRVEVVATRDNRMRFQVEGVFAGRDLDALYRSDGMITDHGEATPAQLTEAVLVGMVRMGILHNVAMLAAGQPPDHAGGGVAEWVQAKNVDFGEALANGTRVAFDLVVAGQESGAATLELDRDLVPTGRVQRVEFPEGVMNVDERYEIELGTEDTIPAFTISPSDPGRGRRGG